MVIGPNGEQMGTKKLADALINEKLKKETIDVTLPGKKIHTGYLHPLHKVVEEILKKVEVR